MKEVPFLKAMKKTFDLSHVKSLNQDLIMDSFRADLEEILELNNPDVMHARHELFGLKALNSEDWAERTYDLSDEEHVIAGIRHLGGDVEKPFIGVTTDFELSSWSDLQDIIDAVLPDLEIFRPAYLNFWLNPSSEFAKELNKEFTPARRYVVGKLPDLKQQAVDDLSGVEFKKITDESYREWYEEQYEEFHKDYPDLVNWVSVNPEEDMNDCIEDGHIYYVLVDGVQVGLIAGSLQDFLGHEAMYMTEVFLAKEFRGQGLSSKVHQKFYQSLPEDIEYVWGTIDAKNTPSTKVAHKVGRKVVREEFFIPIDSLTE